VRLSIIGFRDRLSKDIVKMIEDIEDKSKNNTGLHLTIALDYGARQEILNAVNNAIQSGKQSLSKEEFESLLLTKSTPDPDLIIRTSGEMRISNFLLWQAAYSEFVFSDKLWPDFTNEDFDDAIQNFRNRDRRYGGIAKAKQS
jgi:undecaprenyl diphosphate synthase